jgi:hypothetical protein
VIMQKRLLFEAFREVAIPCIAESRGCSCETIINHLKVIPTPNVVVLGVGELCRVSFDSFDGMGWDINHSV